MIKLKLLPTVSVTQFAPLVNYSARSRSPSFHHDIVYVFYAYYPSSLYYFTPIARLDRSFGNNLQFAIHVARHSIASTI